MAEPHAGGRGGRGEGSRPGAQGRPRHAPRRRQSHHGGGGSFPGLGLRPTGKAGEGPFLVSKQPLGPILPSPKLPLLAPTPRPGADAVIRGGGGLSGLGVTALSRGLCWLPAVSSASWTVGARVAGHGSSGSGRDTWTDTCPGWSGEPYLLPEPEVLEWIVGVTSSHCGQDEVTKEETETNPCISNTSKSGSPYTVTLVIFFFLQLSHYPFFLLGHLFRLF